DAIHLPFDQDGVLELANRLFRVVQVEQHPRLRVNRRLRRVQIFRACLLIGGKRAAGEGNYFALVVADREHDAVAEFGIDGSGLRAASYELRGIAIGGWLSAVRVGGLRCIVILSGAKDLLLLRTES